MGLDMYLHGRKPEAEDGDYISLARWRKNGRLHDLIEREFKLRDEGGFMAVPLGNAELKRVLACLRAEPYRGAAADMPPFENALAALNAGELGEVVYSADW